MAAKRPAVLHQHFLKRKLKLLEPHPALCVSENVPVKSAVTQMKLKNMGCMVVTNKQGEMTGIISERDVLLKLSLASAENWEQPVSEFMTPNPRSLRMTASIARVLYEMATGKFRHLPIVGGSKQEPIGIVSVRDFLEFVHRSISENIAKGGTEEVVDAGSFDNFFRSPIKILEPKTPETVRDILSIRDALERMLNVPIGAIVVLSEDQRICGIFSERDFIQRVALQPEVKLSAPIKTVATPEVTSALESSSVSLVFELMAQGHFRHMPIVDADEDLVGILSLRNFVEYLSSSILEELERYESPASSR